jgi:hypothetical protein
VGYGCGSLHIIKLADIMDAVTAADAAADMAAAAAAGSKHDPGGPAVAQAAQAAGPAAAVPRAAALPAGCVWSVDCGDRLVSCVWAAGQLPELATAGPQGVKIRRFVEVRGSSRQQYCSSSAVRMHVCSDLQAVVWSRVAGFRAISSRIFRTCQALHLLSARQAQPCMAASKSLSPAQKRRWL